MILTTGGYDTIGNTFIFLTSNNRRKSTGYYVIDY